MLYVFNLYTVLCQLYLKQAGKKQLTVNLTKKYAHKIKHMLLNYLYLPYDIERTEKGNIYTHIFALFLHFFWTQIRKLIFREGTIKEEEKHCN